MREREKESLWSCGFLRISILYREDDANNCPMKKMQTASTQKQQLKKHPSDKDSINLSTKSNDVEWKHSEKMHTTERLKHANLLKRMVFFPMHSFYLAPQSPYLVQLFTLQACFSFVLYFFFAVIVMWVRICTRQKMIW